MCVFNLMFLKFINNKNLLSYYVWENYNELYTYVLFSAYDNVTHWYSIKCYKYLIICMVIIIIIFILY